MAVYEAHRRYLHSISTARQPPLGVEDKEVRYYTVFLYIYRRNIKDMQRNLREREEELRTEFNTDPTTNT